MKLLIRLGPNFVFSTMPPTSKEITFAGSILSWGREQSEPLVRHCLKNCSDFYNTVIPNHALNGSF